MPSIFIAQVFAVFSTYCSEPPLLGQEVSSDLAMLMTPALPKPISIKDAPAKRQKRASREASKDKAPEVEASGGAYVIDLVDVEGDKAASSSPGGCESDDGNGGSDDDDDDGDIDEGDSDDDEADDEDEEVDEEELGMSSSETPCQPLKKMHRRLREDTPSSGGGRKLHGNHCKSPNLGNLCMRDAS